jgi:hypothetical protein
MAGKSPQGTGTPGTFSDDALSKESLAIDAIDV